MTPSGTRTAVLGNAQQQQSSPPKDTSTPKAKCPLTRSRALGKALAKGHHGLLLLLAVWPRPAQWPAQFVCEGGNGRTELRAERLPQNGERAPKGGMVGWDGGGRWKQMAQRVRRPRALPDSPSAKAPHGMRQM